MQIGVFSDIHGNMDALQAVWDALTTLGLADGPVLNAGDNVGYGADPEACVRFLRARPNIVCVRGNYDKNVAQFPEKEAEFRKKWQSRPPKLSAIQDASAAISDGTREWLHDLPKALSFTLAGTSFVLTHYAPGTKEGLGTWTPQARLEELATGTEAQMVVCGHTHTPFVRAVGGVLFVNPGAAGRDWHGHIPYAVLTLSPDAPPQAHLYEAPRL